MASFAKISENNEVLTVLTLNDNDTVNADGVETESVGQQYLETHNNWPAQMWIQTSYNTVGGKHYTINSENKRVESLDQSKAFRGNFAGIGYIWDEVNQIFFQPKPFASWVKNITKARWESPIGNEPELTAEQNADADNKYYYDWNESGQSWDLITVNIAEDNLRIGVPTDDVQNQ